ncbi:MAG: META domain-containing protein [Prolixibacteraceae bacterium]|nr:META domain-containing protein [Prolixibacteraceae bacterium]
MKIFAIILLLALVFSCRKDDDHSGLFQTWEAKEFMSIESVAYPKNANTKVLLTFNRSGSYHLKLDINSCGGNFATGKSNQIEMETAACTEACCDSKFAEKVAAMLSRVNSYEISGNTLKLNVPQWGYIELQLVN